MMARLRLAVLALAAALPLTLAAAAPAKTTKGFSFQSKGTAVTPAATEDNPEKDPTTHEDFPFTIKPGEKNGTINVHIDWTNPADDWDLYVYRKSGSTLQTVGQSAGAPPGNEENAVADSQGIPWKPGQYLIRVFNYTAAVPDYEGTVRFGRFIPYNQIPIARLSAPSHASPGQTVKLDASASHDPDGSIVNYA